MSDPKLISPLLDGFAMGEPISEHDGVRCCPAIDESTGEKYIVKIISIPASQVKLEALLLSGAYPDQEAAVKYFKDLADGVVEEAKTLKQLSQMEGFLPYVNWQIRPMDDEKGYDIYLLGTYKHSLRRTFRMEPMTHLRAVNLGLDLCAALAVCRRAGYLFVDLKPENVFLNAQNEFRISDLGFVRLNSLKYASLPERYRSAYTAPEITDAFSSLNETLDIYAVGLILYQAYNNGVLPFEGSPDPNQALPPPEYADYEMADIILKACSPKPEDRWQDPMQLGQALVTYMQRNGANDTPIVPMASISPEPLKQEPPEPEEAKPPEESETPQEPSEASEEEPKTVSDTESEEEDASEETESEEKDAVTQVEETTAEETDDHDEPEGAIESEPEAEPENDAGDDLENLSFLNDMEETDTNPDDISYQEVTDEVSEILNQVDDIVAHPVPDPVVAPEPIDVPMPEPILPDSPEEEPKENTEEAEDPKESESVDLPEEQSENTYNEANETDLDEPRKKRKFHSLVAILITLIVLVIAFTLGYLFYKNYYIQSVEGIRVEGENSSLSVYVDSQANSDLLFVTCADDYGNRYTSYIEDGKAVFENLSPNTHYSIKVQINGFHSLTGSTTAVYNTPPQTNILQFSAVTGSENGSALLSFTAETPGNSEAATWKITYSAEDEEEQSITCTGTSATLTGLTVGKEYTIRLVPEGTDFVTGNDTITFMAKDLVYAENLRIVSCVDGKLTAKWDENPDVASWKVHCHLADGTYVETKSVTENIVVFENIDTTQGYKIEVLADGMSVSERTEIAKDSVTVQNLQADASVPGQVTLTWDANSEVDSWTVNYSVEGYDAEMSAVTKENKLVITGAIPGETYAFTVSRESGNVLCETLTVETPEALPFSRNKGNSPIAAGDITFQMCKTPDIKDWNRHDLKKSDYTTSFAVGENASFVLRMMKVYDVLNDKVTVSFVSRNEEGTVVMADSAEMVWSEMWKMYYGFFDVPRIPTAAGNYVVTMYIDGGEVLRQAYSVQ